MSQTQPSRPVAGSDVELAAGVGERVNAFVQKIAGELGIVGDGPELTPEQTSLAIMDRILASETAEAVLGGQAVMHSDDIAGKAFVPRGVRWQSSDFTDGPSFYAVVDADLRDPNTGEVDKVTFTCGSRNVMAALYRLDELGALSDHAVVIVEADRPSRSGYRPQWLELAE